MMEIDDQSIDHALEVLAKARPSLGMQQRLLAGVGNRAKTRSRTSYFSFWHSAVRLQVPAVGTLVAAIACVLLWSHLHGAERHDVRLARSQAAGSIVRSGMRPQVAPGFEVTNGVPYRAKSQTLEAETSRKRVRIEATTDDTNAPSQPAPALALTSQERLLVRAVQTNEHLLLAQLEPMKHMGAERQEVTPEKFLKSLVAPMTSAELDDKDVTFSSSTSSRSLTDGTSMNQNGEAQ
jgi:hypothetical protein